jgi:hypothetical protein
MTPADAIADLFILLDSPRVIRSRRDIANDLAALRSIDPDDTVFAARVVALTHEIARALALPATHGTALEHELEGWRRSAFSEDDGPAHFRLVFRPADGDKLEILGYGHRTDPDSPYYTARQRLIKRR